MQSFSIYWNLSMLCLIQLSYLVLQKLSLYYGSKMLHAVSGELSLSLHQTGHGERAVGLSHRLNKT